MLCNLTSGSLALAILTLISSPIWAEETTPLLDYAPGAQGSIKPSIPKMLEDAKRLGEAWKENLAIQEPNAFGGSYDFDAMRERAMNDPRVRKLLGAEGAMDEAVDHGARYGNKQVFLFASFSMPPTVLRAMMVEAKALDVQIVFRGFVGNSVPKTQAALLSTFGEDAETVGFGIDPTLFTRFEVTSVPALVVTSAEIEPCETSGCAEDIVPPHDRITGNIPLRAGLEIIAKGQGDATQAAQAMLARYGVLP